MNTLKKFSESYPSPAEKIKNWIKNDEDVKQLVNSIIANGGPKTIKICKKHTKNKELCTTLINQLLMFINQK